jgi:hypothetical protein
MSRVVRCPPAWRNIRGRSEIAAAMRNRFGLTGHAAWLRFGLTDRRSCGVEDDEKVYS